MAEQMQMNLSLLRTGYPPAVIRVEDRLAYYDALDAAHDGDTEPFVRLVAEAVERALTLWLETAGVR